MKLIRKVRGGLRFLRSRFTKNSAILLYHRVAEEKQDPFKLCVTPDHFGEQMERLREVCNPLAIDEFSQRQREGILKEGSLCVTFDDGYVDFLTDAVPVLERFEIPAVVYCVTGNLGKPFWWDRLLACLSRPNVLPALLEAKPETATVTADRTGLSPKNAFDRLYQHFRSLGPARRETELTALEKSGGENPGRKDPRLMTADELEALASHPLITIGAHTRSHSSLASMTPENQFAEIDSSLQDLGRLIQKPVTSFSYPFGLRSRDYTTETISAVRKSGLNHALAADPGVVSSGSNPFALPRLWIGDSCGTDFQRRLRTWL